MFFGRIIPASTANNVIKFNNVGAAFRRPKRDGRPVPYKNKYKFICVGATLCGRPNVDTFRNKTS